MLNDLRDSSFFAVVNLLGLLRSVEWLIATLGRSVLSLPLEGLIILSWTLRPWSQNSSSNTSVTISLNSVTSQNNWTITN